MITVMLNDDSRLVEATATVADLLGQMNLPPRGIAVAVNGEVVRRADWPSCGLGDGDRVDVLTAAQGG